MNGSDPFEWVISVDDHVLEPPNLWTDRLPTHLREVGPRIVSEGSEEFWQYEDKRVLTTGLTAAIGVGGREVSPTPLRYDQMRPGCYDPKERIHDMDADGILASLCFPSFPRFCGQVFYEAKDRDLAALCVRAYNDWMIDEWSGSAPGRFIPLVIIPLWDPVGAAAELERCAGKGALAFTFSENPQALGLPSLYDPNGYWHPVLSAASETGLAVCTHIGSSSRIPTTGPESPAIVSVVLTPLNAMNCLVDWMVSGVLLRYPNLTLCLSEGGIGWIPSVLERIAYTLDRHRSWAGRSDAEIDGHAGGVSLDVLDMDVHKVFQEHVYGCFIDDIFGAMNLDAIGVDNVMIESDYPHPDSTWPNTCETLAARLAGRPADVIEKVLRGNAKRAFNFRPADFPTVSAL